MEASSVNTVGGGVRERRAGVAPFLPRAPPPPPPPPPAHATRDSAVERCDRAARAFAVSRPMCHVFITVGTVNQLSSSTEMNE
ncbi:hypothetical protein JYU34_007344 [Plutella xylostella]|uniref:Uncharacterized protein n=1 Tax=Plutella xylostella TaxID=51655 RepID=A0ABQ7QQA5_PLUXY|nr:hypothetical protein JYU34_007344 [Plutella xylostella]